MQRKKATCNAGGKAFFTYKSYHYIADMDLQYLLFRYIENLSDVVYQGCRYQYKPRSKQKREQNRADACLCARGQVSSGASPDLKQYYQKAYQYWQYIYKSCNGIVPYGQGLKMQAIIRRAHDKLYN